MLATESHVNHPLRGRTAILSTKHQKGSLIAPAIEQTIGMRVCELEVDTDLLGTFTGEVERKNGPLETAIQKAQLGLRASGEMLGLASEGSIGMDPFLPITTDYEVVAFVNLEDEYEVWEAFRSPQIIARSISVLGTEGIDDFLASADFPNHGLIVRPSDGSHAVVYKGIHDYESLKNVVAEVAGISADSRAVVETDLRALHCPSRRVNIEKAASKLADRLRELCPACATPGWGIVRVNRGLPCAWCAQETTVICEEVFGCVLCKYEIVQQRSAFDYADPGFCEICNP